MNTAEKIVQALESYNLKAPRSGMLAGEYRSNSPLRPGSNSHSFTLRIDDGEHGAYHDHVSGESGSLYDLAKTFGIEIPIPQAEDTKRAYTGLADYAQAHGIPADALMTAGWTDDTYQERPALAFKTRTGIRYRFLDGEKPVYKSPVEYERCWYGLDLALLKHQDTRQPLIVCNGEISTVAAQYHGLPAIAVTGGEKRIPDHLLSELKSKYPDGRILVALDCDATGRAMSVELVGQLRVQGYDVVSVDMGLTTGGDLADFCRLHNGASMRALQALIPEPQKLVISRKAMLDDFIDRLFEPPSNPPIPFPLNVLHEYGGMARIVPPGKIIAVVGASGSGKTSMLETLADSWIQLHFRGIIWSPEWDQDEMAHRAIQRYGGPTMEQIMLYKLHLWEQDHGHETVLGERLTANQIAAIQKVIDHYRAWKGDLAFIPEKILTSDQLNERLTIVCKQADEPYHFAILDYAQLLHSVEAGNMSMYELITRFKLCCEANNLIGVVASQTTKQDSRLTHRGKVLDDASARWVNSDAFNLFVTIQPEYNERGDALGTGIVNVAKNSLGRKGKVRVELDLARLRWLDKKSPNQHFGERLEND